MKKYISLIIIYFITISAFAQSADCNSFEFLDNCAKELGEFTFVKSYNVKLAAPKPSSGNATEFQYILSRGHTYIFVICGGGDKEMELDVLNKDKKKIATNNVNRQYHNKIQFDCNATGAYYLKASFKGGNNGCGAIIIGFKKPQ